MKYRESILLAALVLVVIYPAFAGYYDDAHTAYSAQNYNEAVNILEEGLQAAPNDEELARFLGQVYFKLRETDKAEKAFHKTVSLNPDDEIAQYYLGICYTLRKENDQPKPAWFEASQAFAKAVELNPSDHRYNYQYGHALLMLRKFQQAKAPLEVAYATEEGRGDYKVVTDLGIVYQALDMNDNAIELFEKAIGLNPEKHAPYQYLGGLYMAARNFDKVKDLGEKLIQLQPEDGKGYSYRGYGQLMAKEYRAAEETFTRAIALDGSDPNLFYQRGLAREGMIGTNASSYKSLVDDYAKAISTSTTAAPAEWHFRLGHAYELEATLYWDRAFRHPESRTNCLHNLRKAKQEYEAAGDNADAKNQLGTVNERIRQLEVIQ
ncbi:tetratricopeptide repeat protein [bacterium]|nr:tetratricopeptide repeat protein [candidate division CSSED10-310 bacterium]